MFKKIKSGTIFKRGLNPPDNHRTAPVDHTSPAVPRPPVQDNRTSGNTVESDPSAANVNASPSPTHSNLNKSLPQPAPIDTGNHIPTPVSSETKLNSSQALWSGLKSLFAILSTGTSEFGPLKSAIDGISSCVEIFEEEARGRDDYQRLKTELDSLFQDVARYFAGGMPPTMNSVMLEVAKGINREVELVKKKTKRNSPERYVQALEDGDEILGCYRRIQQLLARLSLNADMNILKIVDEQTTDHRLAKLPNSPAATYRSTKSESLRRGPCTPNTRINVLDQLHDWAYDVKSRRIYWLNGMAGTGKTTIAYSLCAQLERAHKLAASFFCSRQLPECRNVDRIIPSIAYQLALFSRTFRRTLSAVVEENPEVYNQSIKEQFCRLIVGPLEEIKSTFPSDRIVVIDALDESDDKDSADRLLDAILANGHNLPIKFLVTSRPDAKILDRMQNEQSERFRVTLHLHELEHTSVQQDIRTYLISELKPLHVSPAEFDTLVQRSGALFIYAATVVRYICSDNAARGARRLKEICNTTVSSPSNGERDIDYLYTMILRSAFGDTSLNHTDKSEMEQVLRTIICAQEPLSLYATSKLLGLDDAESVSAALRPLQSVLHISRTAGTVTTLHESFPNYILDPSRSYEFYCEAQRHSALMAHMCFDMIEIPNPPFNICKLESSYVFDEEIPNLKDRIDACISEALYYACRYWSSHLEIAGFSEPLADRLQQFLHNRLLLWMEVMNLKKSTSDGGTVFHKALMWIRATNSSSDTEDLIKDTLRFMTVSSIGAVWQSTPHIYISGLPFWPSNRPISRRYSRHISGLINANGTAMDNTNSELLTKLSSEDSISCITCLPNSTRVICGYEDGKIYNLDAYTGQKVGQFLGEHTTSVSSVAHSEDGKRVVSSSFDSTIRVWDVSTYRQIGEPLRGHTGPVYAVSYSPNDMYIVSGSSDRTLRVWDPRTGQQVGQPLIGHNGPVLSLAWSPDGARIVSGSQDRTVRLWDVHSGQQLGKPLQGHIDGICHVVYSSNGALVLSSSGDGTIRAWNTQTIMPTGQPLTGPSATIRCVASSSDGGCIIAGCGDGTLRVWDPNTGYAIGSYFLGHRETIFFVGFSSDGTRVISGSSDCICIWDAYHVTHGLSHPSRKRGIYDYVYSVSYSPTGPQIASGFGDGTICIWDASLGKEAGQSIKGCSGTIHSLAYSPNGAHLVSGSDDSAICVWDAHTGQQVNQCFGGDIGPVYSVAYSPDSKHIASGSRDGTVRIWDAYLGQQIGHPLRGYTGIIFSVAFSPDSTRVASGSGDGIIYIWDVLAGQQTVGPLKGHTASVNHVVYSPNGAHIASGSSDGTIRIWDAHVGQLIGNPLEGHEGDVCSIAYSADGANIISSSRDCTICVWDAHTGQRIGHSLTGHKGPVRSVVYSPDNGHIVSGSEDGTIRVWDIGARLQNDSGNALARIGVQQNNYDSLPAPPTTSSALVTSKHQTDSPLNDWVLRWDGWIVSEGHKLLVWIPSDLRNSLVHPFNTLVISPYGSLSIDFSQANIGEHWSQCYRPYHPR